MLTTVIPNTGERGGRGEGTERRRWRGRRRVRARLLPIRDACIIESRRWRPGRPTEGLTRECYFTTTRITRVADSPSFIRERAPPLSPFSLFLPPHTMIMPGIELSAIPRVDISIHRRERERLPMMTRGVWGAMVQGVGISPGDT
ncbi:hypothetical protein PUN28_014447 [Cardiocondyla obscurior]|uniref:Uncharacterized protein n=1 Tax=Cardiocondyla obscurior TaxID=286306 RepID=A0AAW2F5F7_9HYME